MIEPKRERERERETGSSQQKHYNKAGNDHDDVWFRFF